MMDNWRGVEEFVAVAKSGSFRAAADALQVSTSHISRAVADIESVLQAPLFFRSTRHVRLTDTGRALLPQCERLIFEREEMFAMASGTGEPHGELRITCATSIGEHFVAPILQKYVAQFPDVSIDLNLTNRMLDLVGEGIDIAIRTGKLEDSRLVSSRIALRNLVVCGAPKYFEEQGVPEVIEDLANHNCLLGTNRSWQFKDQNGERIWNAVGTWRSNSGRAILQAVRAGLGICQLPQYYVDADIRKGTLVSILDANQRLPEAIWAVYPHQRHTLPKVSYFIDMVKSELQSRMCQMA